MSHRRHRQSKYLELYCCLSNEFLLTYPQPQILSYDDKKKKKKTCRNTNAFNSLPTKYDSKSEGIKSTRIMSREPPNHQVEIYMKKDSSDKADGDKQTKKSARKVFDTIHQLKINDDRELRLSKTLTRTSTWNNFQDNRTASYYNHVQREHLQQPVMLSPSRNKRKMNSSERSNSLVSSIESQSHLSGSDERKTYSIENVVIDYESNQSLNENIKSQSEHIEEFQPMSKISSIILNDILLSSLFPNVTNNPLVFANDDMNKTSLMIFDDDNPDITELIMIDQLPKKIYSLVESIEELCILIRKLLQSQLNQRNITSLQIRLTTQLALLLTYLVIPQHEKETADKVTSTDVTFQTATIETQTDFERKNASNNQQSTSIQEPLSHIELISTSVTIHLPSRHLHYALSDTFVHRLQRYSISHPRISSFSETFIHHLHQSSSLPKNKLKRLLKFVELESSNTFLEASTEFTPDFQITTMNSSKYDDHTEQFGIDIGKLEILPSDSLQTSRSVNKFNIDEENTLKSSITETNSLFLHNTTSLSHDEDEFITPTVNCQLLEPLLNSHQLQMPILLRKSNSIDSIYAKQTAHIRSNRSIVGKRVMLKSISNHERRKTTSILNYNNNYHEHDYRSKTSSLSTIADKFDSNLALAQDLLDMLDSLNDYSSTTNVSSLHMYIQQFLIQFDTRK
ncbi:unnamed protein product [Adineta ricciae]|uniref:Uncharacterized protein n=1 Tax=Adineta ricciae TaxID=249248 RepID=A0A813M699_ADIRI|nr:unnamed protein product [Adineta ricciae]